jgi:hypothetical protein
LVPDGGGPDLGSRGTGGVELGRGLGPDATLL